MLAFHRFSNFCDTIRTPTDFINKFSELEKVMDDTPQQGIPLELYACTVLSENLSSTVPALNPSVSAYTNLARLLDVVINAQAKQSEDARRHLMAPAPVEGTCICEHQA